MIIKPKPKYAAIDVGSNTVRLLIAKINPSKQSFEPVLVERKVTRLGENFEENRILKEIPIYRTIAALKKYKELIDDHGVKRLAVAGTAVIRESRNRDRFVSLVKEETGLPLKVISGIEEAKLSLKGVFNAITDIDSPVLVVDIGGGSTEIVLAEPGESPMIYYTKSLPLGVVKLTEKFLKHNPPGKGACTKLGNTVSELLSRVTGEITSLYERNALSATPQTLISTAGTPTTLAAIYLEMESYDPSKITGTRLTIQWLENLANKLASMNLAERSKLRGLEKGREDIILAGLIILIETLKVFHLAETLVCDEGLLEGLIWDLIDWSPIVNW